MESYCSLRCRVTDLVEAFDVVHPCHLAWGVEIVISHFEATVVTFIVESLSDIALEQSDPATIARMIVNGTLFA